MHKLNRRSKKPVELPAKLIGGKAEFRIIIDSLLGKGGFSQVYRCIKEDEPRLPLVVKVTEKLGKHSILIQNELKVAGRLPLHPNVLRVYWCEQSEHNTYMIMEHCDTSLSRILKKRATLDEEEFVDMFYQLTCGLVALSEAGVLHNDIKPENILISQSTFKLSDFGSATLKGQRQTALYGTLVYSAPQTYEKGMTGEHLVADVFSLGIVFYQALVGRHPYFSRDQVLPSELAVYLQRLKSPPFPLAEKDFDLSLRPLLKVIQRMVQADANLRPTLQELREFAQKQKVFSECRLKNYSNQHKFLEPIHSVVQCQSQTSFIDLAAMNKPAVNIILLDEEEEEEPARDSAPEENSKVQRQVAELDSEHTAIFTKAKETAPLRLDLILERVNKYLEQRLSFIGSLNCTAKRLVGLAKTKAHPQNLELEAAAALVAQCSYLLVSATFTQRSPFPFQNYEHLAGFRAGISGFNEYLKVKYQQEESTNQMYKKVLRICRLAQKSEKRNLKEGWGTVALCRQNFVECAKLLHQKVKGIITKISYEIDVAEVEDQRSRQLVLNQLALLELQNSLSENLWDECTLQLTRVGGDPGAQTAALWKRLVDELTRRKLQYITVYD